MSPEEARSTARPWASPKSRMTTCPWPSTMTLAGLRSRCTTPARCTRASTSSSPTILGRQAAQPCAPSSNRTPTMRIGDEEGVLPDVPLVPQAHHAGQAQREQGRELAAKLAPGVGTQHRDQLDGHHVAGELVVRGIDHARAPTSSRGPSR